MRLIRTVYDVLASAATPCTRAEIERASGLGRDGVRKGLAGLARRPGVLVSELRDDGVRVYAVRPDASAPVDQRGSYPRGQALRRRLSAIMRHRRATGPVCWLGPAAPPSHHAEPGALRTLKQHQRAALADVPRLSLAELLKR